MIRYNIQSLLFICVILNVNFSCNMKINPPIAEKISKKLIKHSDIRIDDYYWLNERENKKVINYLNEENSYTSEKLKSTNKLQKNLFEEMKNRIKKDDSSVPYFYNEYWYIKKFEKGKDYPIYTRKHKSLDNNEEVLIDVNILAKNHSYYNLGGISISPDNKKLAYSSDTLSRRLYTIRFLNIETGKYFEINVKEKRNVIEDRDGRFDTPSWGSNRLLPVFPTNWKRRNGRCSFSF